MSSGELKVAKEREMRRNLENDLKKSREFLYNIINSIDDLLFVKNEKHQWVVLNNKLCEFIGKSREELIGKSDYDIFPQDQADVFWEKDQMVLESGIGNINEKIIGEGNNLRTISTRKTLFENPTDNKKYIVGISRDITEQKKQEAEILLLYHAMHQSPVSVIITNVEGKIEYVNAKFSDEIGYTLEEVKDKTASILKPNSRNSGIYEKIWKTIKAGQVWTGEFENKTKSGAIIWEEVTIGPSISNSKNITHFVLMSLNITDRKILEQSMLQAQKMEAIGQLAGGVAHDFNNLLTVINGYSSILMDKLSPDDKMYNAIAQIAAAGSRAGSLTQQLLAFSRKQVIKPDTLDLNHIIMDTKKMLQRLIGENIDLVTKLDEDLGCIIADTSQINQIIMNMTVNARDAMPDGGRIILKTKNVQLDENFSINHSDVVPGTYVQFSISDNGIGIEDEIQNRIFEPFFSTKEPGKGTGLGLSTVYGIVKQNNGYIGFQSEPNKGTIFKIYFPKIENEKRLHSSNMMKSVNDYKGSEKLLLVENDQHLRRLTKEILENAGYEVLLASNGKEALDIVKDENCHIDLLITDVIMPEMGGKQLFDSLKSICPDLNVIYISGYTDETISRSGILKHGTNFLQKPFIPIELVKIIRLNLNRQQKPRLKLENEN